MSIFLRRCTFAPGIFMAVSLFRTFLIIPPYSPILLFVCFFQLTPHGHSVQKHEHGHLTSSTLMIRAVHLICNITNIIAENNYASQTVDVVKNLICFEIFCFHCEDAFQIVTVNLIFMYLQVAQRMSSLTPVQIGHHHFIWATRRQNKLLQSATDDTRREQR